MKVEELRVVSIQDIHIGPNQNNALIYEALKKIVYPNIRKIKPHIIMICGDDTDDRLSLNQSAARYYLDFINDISNFKNDAGEPIPVRFIGGTESHQKGQLQSLEFLTSNPSLNVKTIETVSTEDIFGVKILYVPEESVTDKYEYYQKYIDGSIMFDLAFGHGLFDHIAGNSWGTIEERSLKGSPVWNIKDFQRCVYGGVFFGHIHIASVYKDFIYYGGSLSRNCQGEPAPKGFLNIYYNPVTHTKRVDFIENTLAPKYVTVSLTAEMNSLSVDEIVSQFGKMRTENGITDLRVMIDRTEVEVTKLQMLRKYFSDNRNDGIRIELKKEDKREEVNTGLVGGSSDSQGNENNVTQQPSSVFASRYPEIRDPNDWEFNTLYFAEAAYGVSISKPELATIISKARSFDKGENHD